MVIVGGDAGIGKSRLVTEFGARARDEGGRVLVGGCLNLDGGGISYGPFLEALRALGDDLSPAEVAELVGDVGPELVAMAPQLARFMQVPDEQAEEPRPGNPSTSADQARLFELSLTLLDRLSADRPLVVILEDLHWSDRATRDMLEFLAHNLRRGRVMLVGTFRSDDLEPGHPLLRQFAELTRLQNVERVDLRPLGPGEQRSSSRRSSASGRDVPLPSGSMRGPAAIRSSRRSSRRAWPRGRTPRRRHKWRCRGPSVTSCWVGWAICRAHPSASSERSRWRAPRPTMTC